jgi:RecB family exonuclease
LDVESEIEGVPVRLVGIIDRVFRDEDGGLGLMELKTGKWSQQYKLPEMRMEMSYYKMLIEMTDPAVLAKEGLTGDVTHWGWRYSAADHVTYEECKRVSERAMKVRLGKLVKMYLNEQFDMVNSGSREGWKCARCDYMQHCPQFQAEAST